MGRKNKIHPLDRPAIREGFSLNIDSVITGIPNAEQQGLDYIDTQEWLLNKARQERFIRSVGTLATLDAEKLEELVEEKRTAKAERVA